MCKSLNSKSRHIILSKFQVSSAFFAKAWGSATRAPPFLPMRSREVKAHERYNLLLQIDIGPGNASFNG
jgi:hypothetical protein